MNSLGIDIGTTGICGIIVDCKSGEILDSVNINNDSFIKTDKDYERIQSPERITEIVENIVKKLCNTDTKAIGISNQMHGILYADESGKAISPLYTWQDARGNLEYKNSKSYAEHLGSFAGYGLVSDFYNRENGLVPESTKYIMTIGDYIAIKLCQNPEPIMHVTNAASLGLFDIKEKKFKTDLSCLPRVTDSLETVGVYNGIPVTVALGDNQASFIGSVSDDESALLNFGTGSQISVIGNSADAPDGIEARPFTEGKYLYAGCALCGGRAFAAATSFIAKCAELATGERCKNIYKRIDKALESKDATSIIADTRFCGTRLDPTLKGSYSGIDENNFTPEDILLSTIIGMSQELYDMYKLIGKNCEKIVCSGNGIRKNPALRLVTAEMFGKKINIPLCKEEAAYGAALSAMAGSGVYPSLDEARQLIRYE